MRLGAAAHRVLDRFARERAFEDPTWEEWVEDAWAAAIEEERIASSETGEAARFGPPERWPNFELKKARLERLTDRLRDLLGDLPDDAVLATEVPLSGHAGALYGIADLIVRGQAAHRIIDYKTGAVVDRQSGEVYDAYAGQLQIYAYLEAETYGSWPETAHLLPLEGRPVDIDVDPDACIAFANSAVALLEAFNNLAPGAQPASPAPARCDFCPFVALCPAFWKAYEAGWDNDLLAASGRVLSARSTPLGGITLEFECLFGFSAGETVVIRNIDPEDAPAVRVAGPGTDIAAVGLREETTRGTYRLLRWGALFVADSPPNPDAPVGGPGLTSD